MIASLLFDCVDTNQRAHAIIRPHEEVDCERIHSHSLEYFSFFSMFNFLMKNFLVLSKFAPT